MGGGGKKETSKHISFEKYVNSSAACPGLLKLDVLIWGMEHVQFPYFPELNFQVTYSPEN